MTSKRKQKYFENDCVVNKLCGIFSANYCWPQSYEQSIGPKNWSKIMIENNEWFSNKMFTQVVKKIPIVTNDYTSADIQINKCLFALILKELELLTVFETQYYESILDLYNDRITFGVIFWLKLCQQFNWRLIYVQMISDHKNCFQLIDILFKEINIKSNENVLTNKEFTYLYSLIDCIVIKVMSFHIIEGKDNDIKLVHIHNNCRQKLCQLNGNSFVFRLALYNVLTQNLIEFALKLMSTEFVCKQLTQKQLLSIEDLIRESFNTENEINLSEDEISKDISIARDYNESLELINRQYLLAMDSKIELSSLQKFYNYLNNNFAKELQLKQFNCLKSVLNDRENPYYKQILEILLLFADFERFESLFVLINELDINDNKFIPILIEKVKKTREQKAKKFFASLLYKSLKSCNNIDLNYRLKHFDIRIISEANCDLIKTLFNQMTEDNKLELIKELNQELLIGVYLDPFSVYDMILDLCLHHNRAQIPFVADLVCGQLYELSELTQNEETFLMKFIIHKLMVNPSLQLLDNIIELIKQLIKCKEEKKIDSFLSLEQFFFFIIKDNQLVNSDLIWIKLLLIKQLIELSVNNVWHSVQTQAVPVLVFLIQFLDLFWQNPSRKQLVVDIINCILKEKMTRNLSEEEVNCLENLLSKYKPITASTHKIYLSYIEKRFPKHIKEVIDIKNNIFHDQILLYASITKDFMWICDIYHNYEIFIDHIKIALRHILTSLIAQEWEQLFNFLRMYFCNSEVISLLRTAIIEIDSNVDKKFMIQSLIDIVFNHLLIPMRDETIERPLTYDDLKYREQDLGLIFRSMSSLDFLHLTPELRLSLSQILIELSERMKNESMDGFSLFVNEDLMSPIAKQVLNTVYKISNSSDE